ncbi:AraC family transcriptional regulator [Pseudohalioglobus lutimaris]|uniref:HTH araC/xylS-type domain-containing protein n=1 Tax=Pseudohalioglobus lutimaris TaxID=1737061 RepID=A0A2N5X369_9GAMM|nr:AraC family transcriptional regulator [Pseudohalioglobus lutimaris]PLW68941.1 hypothetical protein C0039_09980 [Pseudohalioglobus lutimaris]
MQLQSYIRGGVLEFFESTAESLGADAGLLLSEADVAPEVVSIRGTFLPYASYMQLMGRAADVTNAPHFGLLMSRRGNAETLGTVGMIMTQADTVGDAWQTLSHFYRIHDTYGRVSIYRYLESAMISYGLPRNDQPGTRQVYDVAAGITSNIMRQFCGAEFRAEEIIFPYPQPQDTSVYSELPARRIGFDSGSGALETYIRPHYLEQPLQGRSDELRSVLGSYFSDQPNSQAQSTSAVVEDIVRRLLPTGDCNLPLVARTLAMNTRTVQARLEAEQSSFRQILERVRKEIATFHLRRGDMQLTQLAMVLGYSELSAFSRSFRTWYGVSPRKWAEQGNWTA